MLNMLLIIKIINIKEQTIVDKCKMQAKVIGHKKQPPVDWAACIVSIKA